jgi:hypothetical protein
MLQVHLFDRILKPNANKNLLWNSIDATKLQEGLLELATIVQRYKADRQAKSFELIGAADQEKITLQPGKENTWFPALACYGIPLVNQNISSILRDIVKLNKFWSIAIYLHSNLIMVLSAHFYRFQVAVILTISKETPKQPDGFRKCRLLLELVAWKKMLNGLYSILELCIVIHS